MWVTKTVQFDVSEQINRSFFSKKILALGLMSLLLLFSGCALFGGSEAFEIPITVAEDFDISVPIPAISGLPAGQTTPEDIDLPIPAFPVDLIGASPEIESNQGKFKSLLINRITVTPKNNTLSEGSLPAIDLFVGPSGGEGTIKIATIPPIPAGSTAVVNAVIDPAGMEAAQVYISSLNFVLDPQSKILAGEVLPSGGIDLNLEIEVTAIVDPTK